MTEVDIRTRFTIIQPCCGLSFFFPPAHTHTGLFANASTLLDEMYASCAKRLPIDLCCWFSFRSRLSWMNLLFASPFGSGKHSLGTDACPSLSVRLTNRLSTKTTWSWRKETSTSTPSWPGRPTPTHTSLTSTPTMIINPYSRSDRTPPTSPLCSVSRFLTPCVGWSHPDTLRQLERKQWRARLPTEGNNGVLSGALGYTWKTFLRLIQKLMTGIFFQRGPKEG